MQRQSVPVLMLVFSALGLSACGGGGDGSSGAAADPAPDENALPTATIVFPPADAIFTAETLTIRGRAADEDGTVSAVRVNGIEAESNDGFVTWTAKIDVAMGSNTITVEVVDDDGDARKEADARTVVRNVAPFGFSEDIVVDTANGRALVLDRAQRTLFAVDLETRKRSVVSGQGKGEGPIPGYAVALAVDPAGTEAYVAERTRILVYDLETGDRREIFSTTSAELFILDIAFDAVTNKVLAVGAGWDVHLVDPLTGDDTLLSSDPEDCGTFVYGPDSATATRGPGGRWIVGSTSGQLLALSDAGSCELIYDDEDETGFAIDNLLLDSTSGRLYFTSAGEVQSINADGTDLRKFFSTVYPAAMGFDPERNHVLLNHPSGFAAHDLDSGEVVSTADDDEARIGPGPSMTTAQGAAFDFEEGVAYVIDSKGEIFEIDMMSGARASFLEEPVGTAGGHLVLDKEGNRIITDARGISVVDIGTRETTVLANPVDANRFMPGRVPFDAAGNRLIYTSGRYLYALDLDTFKPDILASLGSEDGLEAADLDMPRNRAIVAAYQSGPNLLAIDLSTGQAKQLAELDSALEFVVGVQVDATGHHAWLIDEFFGNLVQLDLETGEMEIVSGDAVGHGISIADPLGIDVDEDSGIAWFVDTSTRALVAVDLSTGDRVIVSR